MLSRKKTFQAAILVIAIVSVIASIPQAFAVDVPAGTAAANPISFPYIAASVGDNVNVRAGGGQAYYSCGKLKAGQKVTVVGEEYGRWSKIVPPPGSYSWISKNYIDIDPKNPSVGTLTGESVRVWAGSPLLSASRSSKCQAKLNKSKYDMVELLGPTDENYLKIAPPSGAYLFVRSDFLKYQNPVGAVESEPVKPGDPDVDTKLPGNILTADKVDGSQEKVVMPDLAEAKTPSEKKLIAQCTLLAEQIESERQKPLKQQKYDEIKKSVVAILESPTPGKAKAYAEYLENLIGRFELAMTVDSELMDHRNELYINRQGIEKVRAGKIAEVKDPGRFIVTGTINPSQIFNATGGQKRYLIRDDKGKIICYAVPERSVRQAVLNKYIDKKVALVGRVEGKSFSSVGLVKFTDIVSADLVTEK